MKLDNMNRWLTLLANVGVIAGIVFLGTELRQNNELPAAEALLDLGAIESSLTHYWWAQLYRDQAFA